MPPYQQVPHPLHSGGCYAGNFPVTQNTCPGTTTNRAGTKYKVTSEHHPVHTMNLRPRTFGLVRSLHLFGEYNVLPFSHTGLIKTIRSVHWLPRQIISRSPWPPHLASSSPLFTMGSSRSLSPGGKHRVIVVQVNGYQH